MKNDFYNDFDTDLLGERTSDFRTPFQQGRDRIIYSSAFRRLQAKTQVFSVGEYDFYRTRLTHSIEVAQIGRSICNYLRRNSNHFSATFYVDHDLVEASCLAHDLGHPPFGHAGEQALHEVMQSYGGFEGNAQTLRILTETIFSQGDVRAGMKPTRALLDGVLKYKTRWSELDCPNNHFLYEGQTSYLDFVFDGWPIQDVLAAGVPRDAFRSIECQVMDWADDTAYSLNDLTDGIRAGFLTAPKIENWAAELGVDGDLSEAVEFVLRTIREGDMDRAFGTEIGEFIQACSVVRRDNPMAVKTNRYAFGLHVDDRLLQRAKLFSRMAVDLVFQTAELQQLEHKTRHIVTKLFECLSANYLTDSKTNLLLLPAHREVAVTKEKDRACRARLLCDYIAGMTDGFAVRTYRRLFDPKFGSIVDLV